MSSDAINKRCYALYAKGLEALEHRDFNKVLKFAAKLHDSRYTGAFELEARARYEMGDRQDATRILETGLRKYPNVYILASYLGEYQSNQGHYQLAIEAFEKARSGDRDVDSFADLNIGICYSRMQMHDRAAEFFAKVQFTPGYHGWLFYWTTFAKNSLETGDEAKFLDACEAGITLAKREKRFDVKKQAAWLYGYRAEYYTKQGKRASAEEDLSAARTLDSHNEQYFRAFRMLHGEQLDSATCYRVVLEGVCENAPGVPKKMGMLNNFEIFAKSEADLVPLAQLHAEPWQRWETISTIKSETPITNAHSGVTWMAEGLTLYGQYTWLARLKSRLTGGRISKLE